MKPRIFSAACRSILLSSIVFTASPILQAATVFWDGGNVNIGTVGDNASAGGSGTWSTGISNWDPSPTGSAHVVWTNGGDDANFGGTAGTVTLGTAVTVGQLSAATSGYVFAGTNTITLNNGTTNFKTNGTTFNSTVTIATNAKLLNVINTTNTSVFNGVISGAGGVTIAAATTGEVDLFGSNTYSGVTTINAGVLNSGSFAAVNTASGIGKGSSAGSAADLVINGGTLKYSGTAAATTNRLFTIGTSGATLDASGTTLGTLSFTGAGSLLFSSSAAPASLTLTGTGGAGTGAGSLASIIGNSGTGLNITSLTKSGNGTWTLSGANTYTGGTTVNLGTLKAGVATKAFGSNQGALTVNTGGTVDFNGKGVQIGYLTGTGGTVLNNVSGIASTVNLFGSTGSGNYFGVIADNTTGTGTILVNKAGTAAQTFSGLNTYTGTTTVTSGTLTISSTGSLGNTAISAVNANATFGVNAGSGTVNLGNNTVGASLGATLTLPSGTVFSMVDGTAGGTTNLVQGATFGTALTLTTATLNFELSGATADNLAVTGAASTASVTGTNTINLTPLAALTAGTYNLITTANAAGGLSTGGTFRFANGNTTSVGTFGASNYLLTLNNAANLESVTVGAASAMTWTGQTAGNGATDASWNTIGSTNFALGTTPVGFVNGNAVTFQDTNTVTAGNVAASSLAVVIQAAGVSPGSTTFNNSAVNYTVSNASGNIGIAGAGTLTKSGTGTLTLSGTNTYTGSTTVSAGTLTISGAGTIYSTLGGGTATVTVASAAQILLSGTATNNVLGFGSNETWAVSGTINSTGGSAQTLPSTVTLNNGTLSGIAATGGNAQYGTYYVGGATITANGTSNIINAANIGMGGLLTLATPLSSDALSVSSTIGVTGGQVSGGVTKTGAGTVTLTGSNIYTGTTTIAAGTLNANSTSALGDGSSTNTLVFTGGTLQAGGAITSPSTRTVTLTSTGLIDTNSNAVSIAGIMSGAGGLTKSGLGTLTLSGSNTYTGATTITGGTLQLATAGTLGAGNYAGTIAISLGATLQDSSSAGQTLSGAISGGGAILKDTNTSDLSLTNTGNTYSGTTTVSAGRIIVSAPTNLSSGATSLVQSGIGQFFITGTAGTYANPFNISGTGYSEGDGQANIDGAIRLDNASTLSGTITLAGNSRIGAYNSGTPTISGKITGGFGIEFYGMNSGNNSAEVFTISNTTNDYTGATTITNSNYGTPNFTGVSTTLKLGASNVIPDGASASNVVFAINGTNDNATVILDLNGFSDTINGLTVNAGTFAPKITNSAAGASVLTIGANNTTSSFGGSITEAGSGATLGLTKIGNGTLTLSGANTYTGTTTVSGGRLVYQNTYASVSHVIASGATLEFNVATGTRDSATTTFSGGGTLVQSGAGNLSWGSGAATFALGAGSLIDVQGGTFTGGSFANDIWTNNLSSLNVTGGATFDGVEANVRVDALTGAGTIQSGYNSAGYVNFTFGVNNGSGTFSGVLADSTNAGSFVKTGTGTQILSGVNTFTGGAVVNGGTLNIANANSPASGGLMGANSVTVNNGATLRSAAPNSFYGYNGTQDNSDITVNAGGSLTMADFADVNVRRVNLNGGILAAEGTNHADYGSWVFSEAADGLSATANSTASATNLVFQNGADINVATAVTLTINGTITDTNLGGISTVIKNGAGTLTLSGVNTYTGTTTISGGQLTIDDGSIATSSNIVNNAALVYNLNANARTYANVISGSGSLTKSGSNTLTLSGVNTYAGVTTISNGGLTIQNSTALGTIAAGTSVASGAVLTVDGTSGSLTIGAEALTLNGAGLTASPNGALRNLAGPNSMAGAVTLGSASTIQSDAGLLSLTGGINNGGFLLTVQGAAGSSIVGAAVSGAGGLTKSGNGTLTLGGGATDTVANSFTGLTTVTAGTLALNKAAGTNAITSDVGASGVSDKATDILVNGGALNWLASNQVSDNASINVTSGSVNFGSANETIYDFNNNGGSVNYGTGSVTILDPNWTAGSNTVSGNLTFGILNVSGGTNTVTGANTGGAGVLTVGNTGGLNFSGTASTNITINSDATTAGKIVLAGNVSSTVTAGTASITSGGAAANPGQLDLGAAPRMFTVSDGSAATDLLVSAQIIGAADLAKAGPGTMTLSATNSYTGATNITDGKLIINGSIFTSNLTTVGSGATLAGIGTTGPALIQGGAILSPGVSGVGTLSMSSLTLDAASTLYYELTGGTNAADRGDVSGALTLSTGSILDLVQLGTYTAGNRYTVFAYNGAFSGTFTDVSATVLADGSTFTDAGGQWKINYFDTTAGLNGGTGTSFVTITAVPEPNVVALLGGCGVLALLRRRR